MIIIVSASPKLAQKECRKRHENVARAIRYTLGEKNHCMLDMKLDMMLRLRTN